MNLVCYRGKKRVERVVAWGLYRVGPIIQTR
jgi:hypothetical protein